MNNDHVELPELGIEVLDSDQMMLVSGGLRCTDDTVSICHQDGTNDEDN